jgi:hypothetical protein
MSGSRFIGGYLLASLTFYHYPGSISRRFSGNFSQGELTVAGPIIISLAKPDRERPAGKNFLAAAPR